MVDTIWLIYLGASPFVLGILIAYKLGGPLEAYYRIARIPYFAMTVFGPDGSEGFQLVRSELIRRQSPPMFSINGKTRQIDESNHAYHHGRPKYYFNYDDMTSIPISLPILKWNSHKINPSLIDAAWNDKFLEDLAKIGAKVPPLVTLLIVVLAISLIAAVVGVASTYYSHNAFCAVNPRAC
jgi:hypothetical protein